MKQNPYIPIVLKAVPRLLTQMDRDRDSGTYGCFDRNYWHYRIRDFPSMVLQQGGLALALLYQNDFSGNTYYKKQKIREWALAAADFWKRNIMSDGSFSEYYPHEHAYPPSVFSLFSVSETCRVLGVRPDQELRDAMLRAAGFISKCSEKGETGALNQEIASVAALQSVYMTTGREWVLRAARKKLEALLAQQSRNGWFPEYGGADIGYLSVSLDYLAQYHSMSRDRRALPALKRTLEFLKHFIHPDGSVGGEYGSRDTEYFLPNGLELLTKRYPVAGSMADRILENADSGFPMDDKYLCHYLFLSFVKALLNYRPRSKRPPLPCETMTERYFGDSGLYVLNTGSYYAVLSLKRGGMLRVFRDREQIFNDCGYRSVQGNIVYTNNWLGHDYKICRKGRRLSVSGRFHTLKFIYPTPAKHILLRFTSPILKRRLIGLLKRKVILGRKKAPIEFSRNFTFLKDSIVIEDRIKSRKRIKTLSSSDAFSMRFCSSSKFFQPGELGRIDNARSFRNVREIFIKKELDIAKGKLLFHEPPGS